MQNQYHHYIPRFLLRNFAVDQYKGTFAINTKQQERKDLKKNKKSNKLKNVPDLLQTYHRQRDQLEVSSISRTYGYENMYKDLNHNDVMHVEKKLSKLEIQASEVIRQIVKDSQERDQIVLLRKDLGNLRKFIFIMNYRNGTRWSQFADLKFDYMTLSVVQTFMHEHNLQCPKEVWLQNINEILDTPHEEVKDNLKVFAIDRLDYQYRMIDCFLVIWKAGENEEFIITGNGFGIFEGVNNVMNSPLGVQSGGFQFPYHSFYVISPKLVLVLCPSLFRQELKENREIVFKMFGQRSLFENDPHPAAVSKYVDHLDTSHPGSSKDQRSTASSPFNVFDLTENRFDMALRNMGFKRHANDTFTFPFVKISSATVHLINSIMLNESKPDLILTFLSHSKLYKTIVKYHMSEMKLGPLLQNFSNLKNALFTELNRTHVDDFHLRRNILVDQTFNLKVLRMN